MRSQVFFSKQKNIENYSSDFHIQAVLDSDLVKNPVKEGEDWQETHAMDKVYKLFNFIITNPSATSETSMTYRDTGLMEAKKRSYTNTFLYHQNIKS